MGLFQRLFGKNKPANNKVQQVNLSQNQFPNAGQVEQVGKNKPATDEENLVSLTEDQFLNSDYVKQITAQYGRAATVLHPHKSHSPLASNISKFGGEPDLRGFQTYPYCDVCHTPLNFVLQLYQVDFPEHYFPAGKNLFQLFRCPNHNCSAAYSEPFHADLKMFLFYFDTALAGKQVPMLTASDGDLETPVPDCELHPEKITDYPGYEEFDDVIIDMEKTYGEALSEAFTDNFNALQRTKTGGYASYTQSAHQPVCDCGRNKEFFFQLSSEDTEKGITNPAHDQWSPHGIMIGDLGNIYFYVCKNCGPETIESYWDCY